MTPRDNLRVLTGARVLRVLVEGERAVGVELARGSRVDTVRAGTEVILAAGVFGTPQLLMLSGIGPAWHLKQHHIPPESPSPTPSDGVGGLAVVCLEGGCGGGESVPCGAFLRSNSTVTHPNIQFHFFPVFFGENWIPDPARNGYRLGAGPMRPESRGTLRLASADPRDAPLIDPNYLATERDRCEMREGLKLAREVLGQAAFRGYHKREDLPGDGVRTDAELDAFIRGDASSAYHPCGTARMGAPGDERAVVDLDLRVRGMAGLRVVDASVIPAVPSANINACVFMVAEKAADLVLGNPALAAEVVPFNGGIRALPR